LGLLCLLALAGASVAVSPAQVEVNSAPPTCDACIKLISELKKIVSNPDTEKKLIDTLKSICNNPLVRPFKQPCLDTVDKLAALLHQVQSVFEDPKLLCQSLKQCSADANPTNSVVFAVTSDLLQSINEPSFDLFEKSLARGVELLASSEVQISLKSGLTTYCNILSEDAVNCDVVNEFVDMTLPVVLSYLANPVSFDLDATSTPHLKHLLATITSAETLGIDWKCTACTASVTAFLKVLSLDVIVGKLAQDLTNLICKLFPKVLNAGCLDFLGIYAKPSLQLTIGEWSAKDICTAMHACSASKLQEFESLTKGPITCASCKAVSTILAYELQQAPLQREIIGLVSRVCSVVPNAVNKLRCQTAVSTWGPYVLTDTFALALVPEMCSALNMC